MLAAGDIVLAVGRREVMVRRASQLGEEVGDTDGISIVMQRRQGVFTRRGMNHKTIAAVRASVDRELRHGVYIQEIRRVDRPLPVLPETEFEHGDVITFFGSPQDTKRAVDAAGYELPYTNKTDFIYMGVGIVLGLLIGLVVVNVGGIPLTLGSGGGCLLAGLAVRLDARQAPDVWRDAVGGVATAEGLRSCRVRRGGGHQFGPAGGRDGEGKRHHDLPARRVRHAVSAAGDDAVRPLRAALRQRGVLAGALTGSRSANPAFGGVLDKAGSAVPTVPFAITYALANVLLTLLGPLIVGLV